MVPPEYRTSEMLKEAAKNAIAKAVKNNVDITVERIYLEGIFSGFYLTTQKSDGANPVEEFSAKSLGLDGEDVYYLVCENISGKESPVEDKKML